MTADVHGMRCADCRCMGQQVTVVDELIPTLDAYESASGVVWYVWCRYCWRWHIHGGRGLQRDRGAQGHRVAHCSIEDSPYERTGYCLKLAGQWDDLPRSVRKPGRRPRNGLTA